MYSCCRRECNIRCQQAVLRHLLREIRSNNSFKNTSSDTYALTKMFRGICPQGFDRSNVLLQIGSEIQNNIKLCFAKHGVEHVLSTKCFETHTLKRKKNSGPTVLTIMGSFFFYMNVALVGLVVSGWACRVSLGLSCLVGLVVSRWACRVDAFVLLPWMHSCCRRGCIRAAAVDVFVLPPWMSSCCRRGCIRAAAVDVFVLPPWMYSCCHRAVVRAGFSGSKRARYNFQIVERTLRRHHANVLVLSGMDDNFVQHSLGCVSGKCIGN
jgi:hypothetical protein